jgi:HSP20 family molecular chaperone IbpA
MAQSAAAAMKAVQKFTPRVDNTPEAVTFKFEAEAEQDVDVSVAGCQLVVDFKKANAADMFQPFAAWSGMTNTSGSGSLKRAFYMPPSLDTAAMTQQWADGVLTVSLPKKVREDVASTNSRAGAASSSSSSSSSKSSSAADAAPRSTADYLQSLGSNSRQQQRAASSSSRPKATGTPRSKDASSSQQQSPEAMFERMLLDFGVPPAFASAWSSGSSGAFTEPTQEQREQWEAQRKEQFEKWQAAAKAAEEKRAVLYKQARRNGMAVDWSSSTPEAYKIAVDLPEGTRAPSVRLTQTEANGVTITINYDSSSSSGSDASAAASQQQQQRQRRRQQRRVQLPRDARNTDVSAKFVREKEGEDFVLRVEITAPRVQPQSINIDMA